MRSSLSALIFFENGALFSGVPTEQRFVGKRQNRASNGRLTLSKLQKSESFAVVLQSTFSQKPAKTIFFIRFYLVFKDNDIFITFCLLFSPA